MMEQRGKQPPPAQRARWSWAEEARVGGAELAGTALLVLLSVAAGAGAGGPAAAGLVVCALVQCLDHVSGAMFNPAVTLASTLWGRVRPARALLMAGAQLAGAALGAAAAGAVGAGAGVTRPAACGARAALALEAAGGAVLALANCAAWDARNLHLRDSWPLRIGATVTALSYSAGWCSGGSFNPARSFGPALLAADWTHHWVYWLGPLAGSLAATALYLCVWRPPVPSAPPARAAPPAPPAPH